MNKSDYSMQAKVWEHSVWLQETNPEVLKEKLDYLLKKAGFKVLNFVEHYFEPQGYTALWLLSESHLAIHTFPEHGTTYLQISSCMLSYYQDFLVELDGNIK